VRIYEATLYERPIAGFKPVPVRIDGEPVSREISAASGGKARYRFYRDMREAWGDSVRIQDIGIRSISKDPPCVMQDGWGERLKTVNAVIRVIGSHGRHFLSENSDSRALVATPFFAYFGVDARNELWYVDRYTRKPILVRHQDWPGFSDGGTLRDLIRHLGAYISQAHPINMRYFGPWPQWSCGGDLWGYGNDMQKVRDDIAAILKPSEAAA
jgi:hypothetical protein